MGANFEKCLAITLHWEGGYSNHPDDPGGPTMRGIIQREYDRWRLEHGLRTRPVRQIEEGELRAIYRANYWDAMNCETLPDGLDLAVFDAAVNSGVGRAQTWENDVVSIPDTLGKIEAYQKSRLAFLERLGKLWRVFGAGWRERVMGVLAEASAMSMAGKETHWISQASDLHAGMKGEAVLELQTRLRALGYPVGEVDGFYGEQLRRAVILFQDDNGLTGEKGEWRDSYASYLDGASPMLPKRASVTRRDLEAKGDKPVERLNRLQRVFGWLFGGSVAAGALQGSSVMESVEGARDMLAPVQNLLEFAHGHAWIFFALAAVGLIALVRVMRADHVNAYRTFTYQGAANAANSQ